MIKRVFRWIQKMFAKVLHDFILYCLIYHHLFFELAFFPNHDNLTASGLVEHHKACGDGKKTSFDDLAPSSKRSHQIYTTDFLVNFKNLNLSKANNKLSQLPMFNTCLTQEKIPKTWTQRCAPVLTMVVQKLYAKPWRLNTGFLRRERWGMWRYCWWFRNPAHQLRLVNWNFIIYIPGGCLGILPSTVGLKMEL